MATTCGTVDINARNEDVFPFLRLPRELRDSIYDYAFTLQDSRSTRALRIERRNLKHFHPSAAAILLVLHHEYLLLNQQVAREALEVLFKRHTVFLSCGPFVLKALLAKIEPTWLAWLKAVELDWVTFPNLAHYPPARDGGRDEWYWETDAEGGDVDGDLVVDVIRGAQYNAHYDEHDHEGGHYDDNLYDPADAELYPAFEPARTDDAATKLDVLIQLEVAPLFNYFASGAFKLSSVTLPLYFISKDMFHNRNTSRPGFGLPLKVRYWVHVFVHALRMLPASLREVRVRYMPWDVWASMDPTDDLGCLAEEGVWFEGVEDHERDGEGEAFCAAWEILGDERSGLESRIRHVKWDGNVDGFSVGDELEVVFTRAGGGIE